MMNIRHTDLIKLDNVQQGIGICLIIQRSNEITWKVQCCSIRALLSYMMALHDGLHDGLTLIHGGLMLLLSLLIYRQVEVYRGFARRSQ